MENIRYCKECKCAYNIGTNFDICPTCRGQEEIKEVLIDGETRS